MRRRQTRRLWPRSSIFLGNFRASDAYFDMPHAAVPD